jgi:flagellar FliJ protein
MTADPSGLHVAIEVAERRRDGVRQELTAMEQAQRAAQAQLDQLTQYAGDSDARWARQAQTCALPELMHHHHQFMARLYHAIGLQQQALTGHDSRVHACRAELLAAELRLSALQKLVARRLHEQAARRARREQQATDELASQRFAAARRTHNLDTDHAA